MDLLAYLMRYGHMIGAAGFVGGLLYAVLCLLPASKKLDAELRADFLFTAQRRSYRLLHPSMLLLLITGIYQYANAFDTYKPFGARIHMVIGLKITLALLAFFILTAQTARLLKDKQARWWTLMALLGLLVIALASYAHQIQLEPLAQAAAGAN